MLIILRAGLLLLFYIFPYQLIGQSYRLINYQTSDGLPTNLTKAAVRDQSGFIWIATDDGIVKFDGKKFKKYKKGTPSDYNKHLLLTKAGKILICNDLGVLELVKQGRQDSLVLQTLIPGSKEANDPHKVHYPKMLFEDSRQNLWISEPTSILQRLPTGVLKRYSLPKKYYTDSFVRSFSFAETSDHTLWAVSYTGFLLRFDPTKNRFEEVDTGEQGSFSSVSAMIATTQQTLWIGANEGVFELQPGKEKGGVSVRKLYALNNVSTLAKTNKQVFIGTWGDHLYQVNLEASQKNIRHIQSYQANVINHILADQENNLWVSSDEGLNLLAKNDFQSLKLTAQDAYIEGIKSTPDGRLLVCDGVKIHLLASKLSTFSHQEIFTESAGGLTSVAYSQGRVFVGKRDGKLVFINEQSQQKGALDLSAFGQSIFSMYTDRQQNLWVCQYDNQAGVVKVDADLQPHHYSTAKGILSMATVVKEDPEGGLFCGARGRNTYLYKYDPLRDCFQNISIPLAIESASEFRVNDMFFDKQAQLWLATTHGLWLKKGANISQVDLGKRYTKENIKALWIDQQKNVWLGTHLGVLKLENGEATLFNKNNGLSTETIAYHGFQMVGEHTLFVATANRLNYIYSDDINRQVTPQPVLLNIKSGPRQLFLEDQKALTLPYNASLEGHFLSFTYPNQGVVYQYKVQGLTKQWSSPNNHNQFTISRIPHGRYTLEVRALQEGNYTWSQPLQLRFVVEKAWYLTPLAIVGYVLGFMGLVWLSVYTNTWRLKRQKSKLETLVQKRTQELATKNENLQQAYNVVNAQKSEIATRNEELQQQQEELATQRDFIVEKNAMLERQSRQIQLSINAAQTIQQAILPYERKLNTLLKEYFIIYKPKDVVSGDFYWLNEVDGKTMLVVADCTGHGVPGAFMTLIGNTLLDKIIRVWKITDPAEVLEQLHEEVRTVLKQRYTGSNNGMDALVMAIETGERNQAKNVVLAGAKMPLYYVRAGASTLERVRGDRRYIGGIQKNNKAFTNKELIVYPGDTLYLGSDGYVDQCNAQRRSFGRKRWSDLLVDISCLPLEKQKQQLENTLYEYSEGVAQRDDILLLGIKF